MKKTVNILYYDTVDNINDEEDDNLINFDKRALEQKQGKARQGTSTKFCNISGPSELRQATYFVYDDHQYELKFNEL